MADRRIFLVYIYCFPHGKLHVGKTYEGNVTRRFRSHCKEEGPLGRALRKYGSVNIRIVIPMSGLTEAKALFMERYYIAEFGTHVKQGGGYNLTDGGDGVKGLTSESAERRRAGAIKGLQSQEGTNIRERWQKAGANSRHGISPLSRHLEAIREGAAKGRLSQANDSALRARQREQLAQGRKTSWADPVLRAKMLANLRRYCAARATEGN